MSEHLYTHRKTSDRSASVPQHSPFQPRPFVVQPQTEEQSSQPDLKTALQRAERYGHRLDQIKLSKTPAPAQVSRIVQAKLTIGDPGDKYEQEADSVAAAVVNSIHAPTSQQSQPSQAVQRQEEEKEEIQTKPEITALQRQEEPVEEIQAKPSISDQKRSPNPIQVQLEVMPEEEELQAKSTLQRREAIGGGEASTDLELAINSARGGGQPLEADLQQWMGQAMGADFSKVKVHTDSQANQLNRSIQARAFTTGQDVFFRSGEYNPGSRGGQELIAHELTHVVQQGGAKSTAQRDNKNNGVGANPIRSYANQTCASIQRINTMGGGMASVEQTGELFVNSNDERQFRYALPEQMTYHHVIPRNKLATFWNSVQQRRELSYLSSGIEKLIETAIKRVEKTPGLTGSTVFEVDGNNQKQDQLMALMKKMEDGEELQKAEVAGAMIIERIYQWWPANLHHGPTQRRRGIDTETDDGGDQFEESAKHVMPSQQYNMLRKLDNLMTEYMNSNDEESRHKTLTNIRGLIIQLSQVTSITGFKRECWEKIPRGNNQGDWIILQKRN